MIHHIIDWSLRHRFMVLLLAAALLGFGITAIIKNPVDAIPDLSENQVIVFTEWLGKNPQLIEAQVTYPLVTSLQGLPGVKYVRGKSMFSMSFISVILNDDVEVYKARSRILEKLNGISMTLPEGILPQLGPDGTGVGHILWYVLDAPGMDLGEQRTLQDWYIRFALNQVEGVSEIASFGGFEKQYEINIDPTKLIHYRISLSDIIKAIRSNNNESGGGKLELNDIGYMIKTSGYLTSLEEIAEIPVRSENGIPLKIKDIATVQLSGKNRLGIFDYNGRGECVGGIVVMRYGENAATVIQRVKEKMQEVAKGMPEQVKFEIVYDRGQLISEAVSAVRKTILEEMLAVAIVVIIFLFHWRSLLSILIQIPITLATAFILLNAFGISSDIMSMTGIVLAIGVITDNGIIMSENAYTHLSQRFDQWNKQQKR